VVQTLDPIFELLLPKPTSPKKLNVRSEVNSVTLPLV